MWRYGTSRARRPASRVYKLLGANRDETEVYATYPPRHESPEGYFEEARQIFDAGFRAYKIHPGALATSDVFEMMAGVRDIAGDDRELMLDPNNGYDFRKALDVGSAADDLGFYWFEDPIPAHEYDNIAGAQQAADNAAMHERQA